MATWPDLVRLMEQARVQTARGTWRGRHVHEPDGDPRDAEVPPPQDEVQRFVYARPDRWRIETADGSRLLRLCDGRRTLLWRDPVAPPAEHLLSGTAWAFSPDPLAMLRPAEPDAWDRADDYSRPTAAPVEDVVLGRRCWRVDLAPPSRKSGVYSLWIDDATGVRLRTENSLVGVLEEFLELELDGVVDPDEFAYDGAVDTSEQDARDRHELTARHYEEHPPPVPTLWPRGVGFHVYDGDVRDGSFVAALEVAGFPFLARHPLGAPTWNPPRPEMAVHRWQDERWQWAIAVAGEPLSPAELAAVIASIPDR